MALHHKAGTVTLHSVNVHASLKKHNLQKHGTLLVYQHALENALIQLSITWQLKATLPSTVAYQNLLAIPTCIPGHPRRPCFTSAAYQNAYQPNLGCLLVLPMLPVGATHAAY